MWSRAFVPIIAAVLTSACSARAEAPSPPRVLVEVMLVEIADADLGLLGEKSFAEIATSPRVTVLSNPHILAIDHQAAQLADQDHRFTVRTDVLPHDELRLELLVDAVNGERTVAEGMRASVAMADAQRLVVKTSLPAGEDRSILAVVRPDIVRADDDLRRVYERKARERMRSAHGLFPRSRGLDRR